MNTSTSVQSVVLGLGATGLSCVRHLVARGDQVQVMDTRTAPPGLDALRAAFPDVRVTTGGLLEAVIEGADLVAVSPGIAAEDPLLRRARDRGVDVAGDIELFARAAKGPVAGITGTNGKSTVTSLLGTLLAHAGRDVAVGGNLGTPALDLLATAPRDGYVLELSSFQLELVQRIDLACASFLNLSPDHLDRYGTMERYAEAKRRIYRHAAVAVFNADDAATHPPTWYQGRQVAVREGAPHTADEWGIRSTEDGQRWLVGPPGLHLATSTLPVAGRHNEFNVLAALAMADALGVSPEQAVAGLAAYTPLPHRCTPAGWIGQVRFIDDSKATNIGACRAAIDGLDSGRRDLVVIVGGQGKGADFSALREPFARAVRAAVLIGEDAERIGRALGDACESVFAMDLDAAVRAAYALARPGGTVLLAPACASFDMFRSYVHRGEAFVEAVQHLAAEVRP
jgi:UDP-N-acetylmuramoylalanine--D-glutamate ligase